MVETLEYTSETATDWRPTYNAPDDDFRRAVTAKEFMELIKVDFRAKFERATQKRMATA
jgi:hypothetical protein